MVRGLRRRGSRSSSSRSTVTYRSRSRSLGRRVFRDRGGRYGERLSRDGGYRGEVRRQGESRGGDRRRRLLGRRGSRGSRPSIRSFKEFVLLQSSEVSPEDLTLEYQKYRERAMRSIGEQFFQENKGKMLILDRYNPENVNRLFDLQTMRSAALAQQFVDQIYSKYKNNLWLCSERGATVGADLTATQWPTRNTTKLDPLGTPQPPFFLHHPGFQSLVLRDIPPHISQWQIHDQVKDKSGYLGTFIAGGVGETPRTALVHFLSLEDRDRAKIELNNANIVIGSPPWHLEFADPYIHSTAKINIAPPITALNSRIVADVEQTAALIQHLDQAYGLWKHPAMESHHMQDLPNPLLSPELDHEISPENRLDLHIFYLRIVHNVCYYSGSIYSDPLRLWENGGPTWVRPCAPFDSTQQPSSEQLAFCSEIDRKWQNFIQTPILKKNELTAMLAPKQDAFCEQNTLFVEENRYRCNLCRKLFQATEYVQKHIHNRHADALEELTASVLEEAVAQAYMEDPQKPLPPFVDGAKRDSTEPDADDSQEEFPPQHARHQKNSKWNPHYSLPKYAPHYPVPLNNFPPVHDDYHHSQRGDYSRYREPPQAPAHHQRRGYYDRDAPFRHTAATPNRHNFARGDRKAPQERIAAMRPLVSYEGL